MRYNIKIVKTKPSFVLKTSNAVYTKDKRDLKGYIRICGNHNKQFNGNSYYFFGIFSETSKNLEKMPKYPLFLYILYILYITESIRNMSFRVYKYIVDSMEEYY